MQYEHVPEELLTVLKVTDLLTFNKTDLDMHKTVGHYQVHRTGIVWQHITRFFTIQKRGRQNNCSTPLCACVHRVITVQLTPQTHLVLLGPSKENLLDASKLLKRFPQCSLLDLLWQKPTYIDRPLSYSSQVKGVLVTPTSEMRTQLLHCR